MHRATESVPVRVRIVLERTVTEIAEVEVDMPDHLAGQDLGLWQVHANLPEDNLEELLDSLDWKYVDTLDPYIVDQEWLTDK